MEPVIRDELTVRLEIYNELRRLDRITNLKGVLVPVHFHERGLAVGKFCHNKSKYMCFSFHRSYFTDPAMPPEVLMNTVRHEYAHYMDYMNRGKSGHGKPWKQCCLIVGAQPVQYFDKEWVARLSARHQQNRLRNQLFDTCIAGMHIDHPRFGDGEIVRIYGTALNRVADVTFAEQAPKAISLDWLFSHCPPRTAAQD